MPTLNALEMDLNIPMSGMILGNAARNNFSNMMTIGISPNEDDTKKLVSRMQQSKLVDNVKPGKVISCLANICGHHEVRTKHHRNGKIALKLIPVDDMKWAKAWFHTSTDSKYDSTFRNIAISCLGAVYKRKSSRKTADDGRPIAVEIYKYNFNRGLFRALVTLVPNEQKDGHDPNKVNMKITSGPWNDMDSIAKVLKLDNAYSMESFENMIKVINNNHNETVVKNFAREFAANNIVLRQGVPEEIMEMMK